MGELESILAGATTVFTVGSSPFERCLFEYPFLRAIRLPGWELLLHRRGYDFAHRRVLASYAHLHFGANPAVVPHLIEEMWRARQAQRTEVASA